MKTATETLSQFRDEISAELEQLETELVTARAAADEAETRYRAEFERWSQVRALAARALPVVPRITDGIAGPLYDRIEGGRDDGLRDLSRARGFAKSRVRNIESSIENRRLALRQIDTALATTPTDRANVVEIAVRPKKATPVEFDTITMPREVTNVTR